MNFGSEEESGSEDEAGSGSEDESGSDMEGVEQEEEQKQEPRKRQKVEKKQVGFGKFALKQFETIDPLESKVGAVVFRLQTLHICRAVEGDFPWVSSDRYK